MQNIILVNENDEIIGHGEKLEIHQKGLLHRAFSIFIFNSKGEMLLHKRAKEKYHSPELWTNTCCSHHLVDKSLQECANQRLMFEMGFQCSLTFQFKFSYRSELINGLIENEVDHIFFGNYDDLPHINPVEVMDWKFVTMADIEKDIAENPENYTTWFKIIIKRVILQFKNNSK